MQIKTKDEKKKKSYFDCEVTLRFRRSVLKLLS